MIYFMAPAIDEGNPKTDRYAMMQPTRLIQATALIVVAMESVWVVADDFQTRLSELRNIYEETRESHFKPVTELQELYARNLDNLRTEATAAGHLEHVIAIKTELDAFRDVETPLVGESFPRLRQLQEIYRQNLSQRLSQANDALAGATKGYADALLAIQVELTKQERLTEALEVKAVIESLKKSAAPAKATPAIANQEASIVPSKPQAPGTEIGTGLTFRRGRLHHVAGSAPETPSLEISSADGISDFVDVCMHIGTWAALRSEGTVLGWSTRKKSGFTRSGIVKLVQSNYGPDEAVFGITTTGSVINLLTGVPLVEPPEGRKVVDAMVRSGHFISLFDDGSVRAGGEWYTRPTEPKHKFPEPPSAALQNITLIAASRYGVWTVNRDGELYSWGATDRTRINPPRPIRGATGIWGISTNDLLVRFPGGKTSLYRQQFDNETEILAEFSPSATVVRCSEYGVIGLIGGNWKPLGRPEAFEASGLLAPLQSLGPDALPLVWLNVDGGTPRANLLWLSAN